MAISSRRIPVVEVIIRDELSRSLQQTQRRLRQELGRNTFRPLEQSFASLGRAVGALRREFSSLLGLTGLGAFLGGGLVAGVAKLTQSFGDLARNTQQVHYTAAAVGLTAKQFETLAARGQALGLTAQESQGQIANLARVIDDLVVKGPKAAQFAEIYKSRQGPEFLAHVRQAAQVSTQAGIEAFLGGMSNVQNRRGQSFLANFVGLSTAWKDALKIKESDLGEIYQMSAAEMRRYNLELLKLNISYDNVKKELAVALMPAATAMIKAFDQFLQGPGGKIAKDFGAWLGSININWNAVGDKIIAIINAATKFIETLDPIVNKMGGWPTIFIGLGVALGVGGLGGGLAAVAAGLTAVAAAGGLAGLANAMGKGEGAGAGAGGTVPTPAPRPPGAPTAAPTTAPTGPTTSVPSVPAPTPRPPGAGGGGLPPMGPLTSPVPRGTGPGGIIQLPEVVVPGKRSELFDPETAAPYRVAGGWQPPPQSNYGYLKPGDTAELRQTVKEVTANVTRLADVVNSLALNTDASGAGPMAGLAGRISSFRGGGGGGGGGRAPRGGGGGGGGGGRAPRGGGGGARQRSTSTSTTTNAPRSPSTPTTTDEEFRIKGGRIPTPAERADTSRTVGQRKNNPFNMWHDKWATQQGGIPGERTSQYDVGALFPNMKAGAAAAIRKMLESELYGGRRGGATIEQVIQTWVDPSGKRRGYGIEAARAAGVPPNTMMTREFLLSPAGLRFLHYMSRLETGYQYGNPLSDDDMKEARNAALRIRSDGSQAPPPQSQNPPADSQNQPAVSQPNKAGADEVTRVKQSQLGDYSKYRYNKIDPRLEAVLDEAAIAAGVTTVNIESGGQGHRHKGSRRHNLDPVTGGGLAADFDLLDERGKLIGRRDPRYLRFLEEMVARGGGGTGVGYMGGARIHGGLTGAAGIIGQGLSLYSGGTRDEIAAYQRGLARYYRDKPELAAILQRTLERRAGGSAEKKAQIQAQQDFDEYLKKQKPSQPEVETETGGPGFMLPRRRRDRMSLSLTLNLRGPRGVRAKMGPSDGVNTTINRDLESDATGGGKIQSPA